MAHQPQQPDPQLTSVASQIELFASLSGDEVRKVLRVCDHIHFDAGERLFEQGDDADALFIISQGELEVIGQSPMGEKVVFAILGPGTVVGEMSLIEGGPRSATVEAVSPCEIFRLSRETFDAMRQQDAPAAYKIILSLAATVDQRRRETDARVRQVFEDPDSHIDEFESQLHEMLGRMRKS